MSDATGPQRPVVRPVLSIQTPIVMTRQYSQAMTSGQINVLVQAQLYGVDELKWTSKRCRHSKEGGRCQFDG